MRERKWRSGRDSKPYMRALLCGVVQSDQQVTHREAPRRHGGWMGMLDGRVLAATFATLALLLVAAAHADDWLVPRTVYVGDSITVRLSAAEGWTWQDVFLAAGGQYVTSSTTLAIPAAVAFLRGPATNRPQVGTTVILLGTGDYRVQSPLPGFTHAYRRLVASLSAEGRVICVLPLPRADETSKPIPLDRYRQAITEVCPDAIDPREVLPVWSRDYFEDGSHPNPEGAAMLAEWLRSQGSE